MFVALLSQGRTSLMVFPSLSRAFSMLHGAVSQPSMPFSYSLAIVKLRAADFSLPSSVNHVSLVACLPPRVVKIYSEPLSLLLPPAMALQRVADAELRAPRV